MSEFNKHVGKEISKDEADKLKKNWKSKSPKTLSSFIGSDILMKLLTMPGTVGIRIHYGMDDEGNMQPVLSNELDENYTGGTTLDTDASLPCPPYCPK